MNKNNLIHRPVFMIMMMAIALNLSSCQFTDANAIKGSGELTTESHTLGFFSEIDLRGAYSVTLSQGGNAMLTIETDDNLHELIKVELIDEKLSIVSDRETVLRPTRMDLFITYPEIHQLSIQGAGKVTTTEKILTDNLFLDMSGAADLHLDIETESLHTRVSGAGNIYLRGMATHHHIELSGASNLKADELICKHTIISLSGAGSAAVYASETLKASMSGVGKITYHGDPIEKTIKKSGLGSISSAR